MINPPSEAEMRAAQAALSGLMPSGKAAPTETRTNPSVITLQQAEQLIADAPWAKRNRAYAGGDHWQGGTGWAGPLPLAADNQDDLAKALQGIMRAFASQNVIGEIVRRQRSGILGRAPQVRFTERTPTPELPEDATEEQQTEYQTQQEDLRIQIAENERILRAWWDDRGLHKLLAEAAELGSMSEHVCVRVFVPPSALVAAPTSTPPSDGQSVLAARPALAARSLEEALEQIFVEVVDASQANVVTYRHTMQEVGVFVESQEAGNVSVHQRDAQITYLDVQGRTVVRQLSSEQASPTDGDPVRTAANDLGGFLPIVKAIYPRLVTDSLVRLQRLLNKALTMMSINMDASGFLERVILNGEAPWEEVEDPESPTGKRRVYKSHRLGPFTTNYIQGVSVTSEGKTTIASPSIQWREPSDPETFIKSAAMARRAMLEEAGQLHTLISGDATASGESRVQAMADFLMRLLDAAAPTNQLGRHVLEVVWRMACAMTGQTAEHEGLRIVFECRVSPGPIPESETNRVFKMVTERLLSRETAMSRLQVEDVEAEMDRLEQLLPSERWRELYTTLGPTLFESATLTSLFISGLAEAIGIELSEEEQNAIAEEMQAAASGRAQENALDDVNVFDDPEVDNPTVDPEDEQP